MRGVGGNVIVVDEMAYIKESFFKEVIVPLLELRNAALLGISTADDEFNFYSQLIEKKDDRGEPMFKVIRAGKICDACQKLEPAEQLMCNHIPNTEHWKSIRKNKRLKALYEDDPARGLRELGGVIASDFTPCFKKSDVNRFMDEAPRYVAQSAPSHIFLTIDPSGGGPSHLALMSGYYVGGHLLVVSYCVK